MQRFKDYKELRAFVRGPKKFTEPKRIGEVKREVQAKRTNKRKSKADAGKVGKPAEDKDEG